MSFVGFLFSMRGWTHHQSSPTSSLLGSSSSLSGEGRSVLSPDDTIADGAVRLVPRRHVSYAVEDQCKMASPAGERPAPTTSAGKVPAQIPGPPAIAEMDHSPLPIATFCLANCTLHIFQRFLAQTVIFRWMLK